jgi:hypothetical protein
MAVTAGVDHAGTPVSSDRHDNPYAADEHALIIAGERMMLPSGRMARPAPTSVAELRDFIAWAWGQRPPAAPHKLLQPRGGTPQVYILGTAALERFGWLVDIPERWEQMSLTERREALTITVQNHLESGALDDFLTTGWSLRGRDPHPGSWIRLSHGSSMVDIILEPYAWSASKVDKAGILGIPVDPSDPDSDRVDTSLPDDDDQAAAELGRRLASCVQHLDVLPAQSSGRTGAAIADRIWNGRRRRGKGVVIDSAGPIPDLEGGPAAHEDLEPPISWTRHPTTIDINADFPSDITHLVSLDQRRAYLGSSGIDLGYGTPRHMSGDEAADAIARGWAANRPHTVSALCRVWLPAGDELATPDWLPLPHPLMKPDRRVQAWVTSRSVRGLCDPVISGGAGLELDDLAIEQAWVWPQQARVLDAWTKKLREAGNHFTTTDDTVMSELIKACYSMYIGRMQDANLWTADAVRHHHQPVWRAFIMADTRWRNRLHAMNIHARFGLTPLRTATDSWVYLIGPVTDAEHPDAPAATPDLADHTGRNGKLKLEQSVEMVDEVFVPLIMSLMEATTERDVSDALDKAFRGEGLWS